MQDSASYQESQNHMLPKGKRLDSREIFVDE